MKRKRRKKSTFCHSLRFRGDALDDVRDVLQVVDQAEDVKSGTRQISGLIDAVLQTSD